MAALGYLSEAVVGAGLQDIRKAVPDRFDIARRKEMATAIAVFFSVARAMKVAGKKRLQISTKSTPNHRDDVTEAYCNLFCDSASGYLAMVMPGIIGDINEGNSQPKNNKARFSSNVYTTRFNLSENETRAYPKGNRDPALLELKSFKSSGTASCEVYFHSSWKQNLGKYLATKEAWLGLTLFMLRNQPFEAKRLALKTTAKEISKKVHALFPEEVANKLALLANL